MHSLRKTGTNAHNIRVQNDVDILQNANIAPKYQISASTFFFVLTIYSSIPSLEFLKHVHNMK